MTKPGGMDIAAGGSGRGAAPLRCLAAALLSLTTLSCAPASDPRSDGTGSPYLLMFVGDRDERDSDFLLTINVDPASAQRGEPVASVPIGRKASMPHHMDYALPPPGEPLFVNAHHHEETLIVDTANPAQPRIKGRFATPAPFRFPHDYTRTPSGTRLVGFLRSDGPSPDPADPDRPGGHGGIAEYSADGHLLRSVSAAAPGMTRPVRPYAFALLPDIDRFVVTSAPMMETSWADVIQIYRLSDFKQLHTIALPPGRDAKGRVIPGSQAAGFGPRVLADGSVFLNSYGCAFYRLTDIASDRPALSVVHALETRPVAEKGAIRGECGIPLVIGRYWLQPVGDAQAVVVLDISNPAAPRAVQRLATPDDFSPHWLASDPASDRLILGAELGGEHGFYMLRFDAQRGRLRFDADFQARRGTGWRSWLRPARPGYISLERDRWPHGATGPAWGHAALFLGTGPAKAGPVATSALATPGGARDDRARLANPPLCGDEPKRQSATRLASAR